MYMSTDVINSSLSALVCDVFCHSQKGRKIETITCVVDLENLSFQRHYYWPGKVSYPDQTLQHACRLLCKYYSYPFHAAVAVKSFRRVLEPMGQEN